VVDQLADETDFKISAVIATHEHQDHISGFGRCADQFAGFDVEEVWMPWTQDPRDKLAMKLRYKRIALAERLNSHFLAVSPNSTALPVVQNLVGNQRSLEVLRSGFATTPKIRYLQAGEELYEPVGIRGLSVRVLGPPRDPEFLGKMDPPAGQRYFHVAGAGPRPANALQPFTKEWTRRPRRLLRGAPSLSPREQKRFRDEVLQPLDGLAFTLDHAVNNTSLVLLISYRGQHLLFPGDAQWGNWKWWLEREGAGELLGQVSFFKVAHHGSHNATPKAALEAMPNEKFSAMVSTQSVPWPSIPEDRLMNALKEKTGNRVVRSDQLSSRRRGKLPRGFIAGEFWTDAVLRAGPEEGED
jgi:hypothetical protein